MPRIHEHGRQGAKKEKEEFKKTLAAILWTGRTDKAIQYLSGINSRNIKDNKRLDELKDYILQKSDHIPCYALRRELGLTISSNRVEKENDLVVASRQKHNDMAWSKKRSGALACIKAAINNQGMETWITKKGKSYSK